MKTDPRERSLRKAAKFIGFGIARRRDKASGLFGYMLYDMTNSSIIAGADPDPYSLSLDDVEHILKEGKDSRIASGKHFN